MHHFPFHIADIDHATARLTLEEFGGLVRLWMAYLKGEKPLPQDLAELQFLTGARTKNETRSLQQVVKRFFSDSTETPSLQSDLCEAIISDYRASGVQSRYANLCRHWEKANKGTPKPSFEQFAVNPESWFETDTGRVRKVTGRKQLVLTSESEDTPNLPPAPSQPITNNQEPITIGTPIVPKGTIPTGLPDEDKLAEAIYAIYPKKVGKTAALKAIVKVLKLPGGPTELELQTTVKAYRDAVAKWPHEARYTREGNDTVPHPATWFNQGRYADDPATWQKSPLEGPPEKKGVGAGGGGLDVPPCVGWQQLVPDWDFDGVNWHELSTEERQTVWQAWAATQQKGTQA